MTPKIVASLLGAAVSAAIATASAVHTSSELAETLKSIQGDVAQIKSDVRLLKCESDFPGDCPGQAPARRRR